MNIGLDYCTLSIMFRRISNVVIYSLAFLFVFNVYAGSVKRVEAEDNGSVFQPIIEVEINGGEDPKSAESVGIDENIVKAEENGEQNIKNGNGKDVSGSIQVHDDEKQEGDERLKDKPLEDGVGESAEKNDSDTENDKIKDNEHFVPEGTLRIRNDNTFSLIISESINEPQNREFLPYVFYVIPESCVEGKNIKSIMLYKESCENMLELTVNNEGTYDFSLLEESLIYGSRCARKDQNCTEEADLEVSYRHKDKLTKEYKGSLIKLSDSNGIEDE